MWPSLPTANHIADVANWFFIGSLAVGIVSTVLIVWMAGVKEAYWEKDRTESAERIAALGVLGDQLRKDTAEANARAVEAKLELEKFKAPRTLSAEQQAAMTAKLRKFAGTTFDMAIGPMGDPEPLYLARAIHAALTSAGWNQVAWADDGGLSYTEAPMLAIGVTLVTNVIVDVHPDHWNKFGIAANELATTLAEAGVAAIPDSKPTSRQAEAIHIRIGRKL